MLYSKLFGKTNKSAKEFESINATLLQKGGFIHQEMAGVYTLLPLGLRVLTKIESIVRDEMSKIGIELLMPGLSPKLYWEQTGRIDSVDVLMKTSGANELSKNKSTNEYILNPTHEDVITPLVKEFVQSYKHLPVALYQIQTKYRNEARAKSGLLRGREFRMKDLYSFHTSKEDFQRFYDESKEIYWNVYKRLGIAEKTKIAVASGGDFTEDYSHEFQTICESGEDEIYYVKSLDRAFNKEVAPSRAPQFVQDEEIKNIEEIKGTGIIGVNELSKFLQIPVEQTTKTILFENEEGKVIAAALRGDYEINEEKLRKITGYKTLNLASADTVKRITGADVGYAGLLNLPAEVEIYMDDSMRGRVNFEMGANKTHFHSINVNFERDIPEPDIFYDFKMAKTGDLFPETGEEYEVFNSAEVGNIFPLDLKFTGAIDYTYTDENGEQKPVYMGSYGIGTTRVMGVTVELFHDERGIIWPESIAPYKVHLLCLDMKDEEFKERANKVYKMLQEAGIEVLFDDREDVSAGEKFGDADLIGCPWRVVVSKRNGEMVEVKRRSEKESQKVQMTEIGTLFKVH